MENKDSSAQGNPQDDAHLSKFAKNLEKINESSLTAPCKYPASVVDAWKIQYECKISDRCNKIITLATA